MSVKEAAGLLDENDKQIKALANTNSILRNALAGK